ncbi:ATP-binding protein [Streptomyces zaomyceticus]|uniref:ATP-binding protein n=1 Tax=Streptomyces zaomyceticus TaxID=68286 RepID=UPI00386C2343
MPRPTLDELPYGFKVPALVKAVPPARRRVRAVAHGLGLALDNDMLASIELLAGEVIANAVRHTDGSCAVCLRWTGTRLRVEVTDSGNADTELLAQVAGPDDENGRGLFLVESIADAWGIVPDPAGKTTWFEISAEPTTDQPKRCAASREADCRVVKSTHPVLQGAARSSIAGSPERPSPSRRWPATESR